MTWLAVFVVGPIVAWLIVAGGTWKRNDGSTDWWEES